MRIRWSRRTRQYAARVGLSVLLVALAACGTRLPDSAFVEADQGPTGARAAGARTPSSATPGASGAAASSATSSAAQTGPAAAGGAATNGSAGAADGPNQASDVGVSENEIVIGNITAQNGILGAAFRPPLLGLQAYVDYINDHGGVHGRTIRLETCDDKEDRTRTLQCAQDLVENKHVFAFIANNTRAEGGAAPYINSQGVPVVDVPITNAPYRYPHYFSIYGTRCPRDGNTVCGNDQSDNTSGIYRWFKQNLGVTKAAVFYYSGVAESEQAANFTQKGLQLEGYSVSMYGVILGNPSFDQAVQQMQSNGTQIIFDTVDDGANRKLCDTMQRYKFSVPAKVSTVVAYGDAVGTDFSDVCRNSVYITGTTVTYSDTSNPGVAAFRDAFATYQPGAQLHQWSLEGWGAGLMLTDYLNTAGATPTRAGFEQWLNSLQDYTYDGLTAPISYQPGDVHAPTVRDCFTIAQWQDSVGGWIQRTAAPGYECYDDAIQFRTPVSERGD